MVPISDVYILIGDRIKTAREERGWTQTQLGEAIGYSQATIGNYELGRRHVGIDDLYKIAEALGKPWAYFIGADQQLEEQAKLEAEQKVRRDVAGFVGVRMLPVLRNLVANGARLGPDDIATTIPVPREFGQRADAIHHVSAVRPESGLVKGDYVFLRRENSGHRGQIVLASVEGSAALVTCSYEDGYLWTQTGQPIRQEVIVVGEFCGLYTEGNLSVAKGVEEAGPPGWEDLAPEDQDQVRQFIAFLRTRRASN